MPILHLHHAVPSVSASRRGHAFRLAHGVAVTPCEVSVEDTRRMRRVGVIGKGAWQLALHAREGHDGLWAPLQGTGPGELEGFARRSLRPVAGPFIPDPGNGLLKVSPLCPLGLGYGATEPDAGMREAGNEERFSVARQRLVSFLDERICLVEGTAFLRVMGPVLCVRVDAYRDVYGFSVMPMLSPDPICFTTPSRLRAHWEFSRRPGMLHGEGGNPRYERIPGIDAIDTDADLLHFASKAPGILFCHAQDIARAASANRARRELALGVMHAMAPWIEMAATGSLPGHLLPEAVQDIADAAAACTDRLRSRMDTVECHPAHVAAYAREIVFPALEREVPAEDRIALEGIRLGSP